MLHLQVQHLGAKIVEHISNKILKWINYETILTFQVDSIVYFMFGKQSYTYVNLQSRGKEYVLKLEGRSASSLFFLKLAKKVI